MTILEKSCSKLSCLIKEKVVGIDNEKMEIINYGLYLIITDNIKTLITLVIAYFLGVFKYVVLTMICIAVLRVNSGGVHAKTFFGCLIANNIIIYSITYLSIYLHNINKIVITAILLPICLLILYLYAPSDHENKPVVSKKQIKRLRVTSFSVLFGEYLIAYLFFSQSISNIIMFSTFSVAIAMMPITYKITKNKHSDFNF